MRPIDKFIHFLMWACLATGLLLAGWTIYYHRDLILSGSTPDRAFASPLVLLWLLPALSLWQWDGARPGEQSRWFYVFATLALLLVAVVALFLYLFYAWSHVNFGEM